MTRVLLSPIPIARPTLGAEELAAIGEVITDRWIGQGPRVARFEQRLAELTGVRHAVAVSSGTAALHLALLAAGLGPGRRVALPSFTFVATANAVLMNGGHPILVDVDPTTYNLDPEDLRRRVAAAGGVDAILPVHQFGLPCDMAAVQAVAAEWGARVIEDAACALGATWGDRPVGGLGLAGCLSFHPRKVITTGEGGAILTNDPALDRELRIVRSHGLDPTREVGGGLADVVRLGFNYRMSDLQASVGLVQLERLPRLQAQRTLLAARYQELLTEVPWLQLPRGVPGAVHGWQSYVVRVATTDLAAGHAFREALRHGLDAEGIATRPGTHAVHTLRLYREQLGLTPEELPGAWAADRLSLALPLYGELSPDQVDRVARTVITLGEQLRTLLPEG